ncbi:MAG TPA: DUF6510 family protein [Actinomycetota bacterium]|jgi:Family of unknown function (DUF6510)|nr:DUF6510 family protein [Actinomycetota bacterium]
MESDAMRVDGNAIAGILGEVFVKDMTAVRIACGGCGKVEPTGAEHVYMRAPGIVMRCCHCDSVLLVVSYTGETYRLGFGGARSLEFSGKL